jgi:preprotein translocase SecE subunit
VARDRKRAKQRRVRRAGRPARGTADAAPASGVELPAALEHSSASVDEFDAALVRGAGGAAAPGPEAAEAGVAEPEALLSERAASRVPSASDEISVDADENGGSGGGFDDDGGDRGGGGGEGEGARERQPGAPLPSGNRAVAFIRASWAELQRVQWPDRRQVTQATAVVLGFVAVAGAYLGLADFVAKEIVEFVL